MQRDRQTIKFRYVVFVVTIYISTLYFSYLAIQGSNFSNEITTESYKIITLVFDALAIGLSLFYLRGNNYKKWLPLIISIFLVVLYYIEDGNTTWMINSFIAFSLPCSFIGASMGVERSLKELSKWLEVIMIFVTTAILISLPYVLFDRTIDFEYQTFSYYCGFAYSINLFFLLNGKSYERFKWFKKEAYDVISIIILVVQAACCLMAGGRGGFVLIILSTLVFLLLSKKIRLGYAIILGALFFTVIFLLPQDFLDSVFEGSERTFSFVQEGKVDLSAASNRDEVYKKATDLIWDRPILGYGIFGYVLYNNATPHNIFLEVLLQGGLVYSLLFWLFMLYIARKTKIMIKKDEKNKLLIAMGIWPFTELLFSSSYMMFGLFWFLIAYIFVYKIRKNEIVIVSAKTQT